MLKNPPSLKPLRKWGNYPNCISIWQVSEANGPFQHLQETRKQAPHPLAHVLYVCVDFPAAGLWIVHHSGISLQAHTSDLLLKWAPLDDALQILFLSISVVKIALTFCCLQQNYNNGFFPWFSLAAAAAAAITTNFLTLKP